MQCVSSLDCIKKFISKNRVNFEHFFLSFVKYFLSIKLYLRDECDDNVFQSDKKIGK